MPSPNLELDSLGVTCRWPMGGPESPSMGSYSRTLLSSMKVEVVKVELWWLAQAWVVLGKVGMRTEE